MGIVTMRHAMVFALACCLWCVSIATAQDKPPALPQERFLGEWVNADNEARTGINRVEVTKKDDTWWIEAWGYGVGATEAPWGKVKLDLFGDNVLSKALPYGFATWETKPGVNHVTIKNEMDELVVETFLKFTADQAAGRSNVRRVQKFKKK
jgi:hypothetical protein